MPESALYGRVYSVSVGSANSTTSAAYGTETAAMAPLRVTFDIEKTANEQTNKGKVTIFNLSAKTRQSISPGNLLCLRAGYQGFIDNLFLGNVSKVSSESKEADIATTIEAGDGEVAISYTLFNRSYGKGVTLSQILSDIAQSMSQPTLLNPGGIRAGIVLGIPDRVFNNGFVALGSARDTLTVLLRREGLEWSVQNGTLNIIPLDAHNGRSAEVVSASTGLIGIPSRNADLVTFNALINPRLVPGGLVKLVTASTDMSGYYKIRTAKFKGDSHGNDWNVEVEAVPMTQAKQTLRAATGFAYDAAVVDVP